MAADLKQQRQQLVAEAGLTGPGFCRAYTALADRWLRDLLAAATGFGDPRGLAVVAVGGYGRQEMCPASDLDVLLVHSGRKDVRQVAERVWYPLWDSGVKLSHGVRTPKEALSLAADDLDTATALLDLRPVAGDEALALDLAERAREQWQKRAGRWLDALADSVDARHRKAGEVAFLLEPDLKDGRGGLRDVHAIRWAEVAARHLWAGDEQALADAHDRLLAVRVELHRRTGRPGDVLNLQEQDGVAEALGHGPPPHGADRLMAEVAAGARAVAWTSDDTWRRVRSARRGPSGRVASADRVMARGVVLRDDEVHLAPDADPAADPGLVLRAAAAAAGIGRPLARQALDRLGAEAIGPPPVPWPDEMRNALVALLAAGHAAIPVIEALDHHGLLTRVLPEWEPVRSRPQRNAYHRFTVDRHLCEAAAEAAVLTDRVRRPDLLLLATWLHDIGKGYPGDHTDAGVDLVEDIAARFGFAPPDVVALSTLVRHHLLLPDLATRRDVSDDATVAAVADAVGDVETLALLHALTEADGRATGPAAWGPWKADLVDELVARAARRLEGADEPADTRFPTPAHSALMADRRLHVEIEDHGARGTSITVVSPDRPGLFSRVAGTLALHGLDVLAADAWSSDDGMAVEVFRVEPAFGDPDWEQFRADLDRALAGRLSLEARLAERSRTYARRAALTAAPVQRRVTVHDDASRTATVVEVRAPDAVGVLYRITRALAELQLDIRHAKVSTLGAEVVDSFYVLDASGSKLTDPDHLRELEQAVLVELGRV